MNHEVPPQQAASQARHDTLEDQLPSVPRPQGTISPARDRLQSRLLTVALGAAVGLGTALTLLGLARDTTASLPFTLPAMAISALFALAVWLLRAATAGGALSGGVISFLLTVCTATRMPGLPAPAPLSSLLVHTGLAPLLLLFLCTFVATKVGHQRKLATGVAENRRGRTASQVLANLAAAALCAAICSLASRALPQHAAGLQLAGALLSLAALAEATADTVSSEIGQAFGGTPRMLLGLRVAPVGTDGAITSLGTASGVAAAMLIAACGVWAMHVSPSHAAAAAASGSIGLFADSLLGATVERRGWVGNDLVNFSSTVIAALTAAAIFSAARR